MIVGIVVMQPHFSGKAVPFSSLYITVIAAGAAVCQGNVPTVSTVNVPSPDIIDNHRGQTRRIVMKVGGFVLNSCGRSSGYNTNPLDVRASSRCAVMYVEGFLTVVMTKYRRSLIHPALPLMRRGPIITPHRNQSHRL